MADFLDTPAGPVPVVHTVLNCWDLAGTVGARLGVNRDHYPVAPGLYAVGKPEPESPVLVTANYKLSFDTLRRKLDKIGAWILVLDTRGVNVWCAASKGTFSTAEVIRQVERTGLDRIVSHKKLVMPQLGATGVSAREVRKGCGFEVVWGPVRASDLPAFLGAGMKADPAMRRVTFTLKERLVLVPVELSFLPKPAFWILIAAFLLSGLGPGLFSAGAAWHRGWLLAGACAAGIVAGTVVSPALLPWIPGAAFAFKGAVAGLAAGGGVIWAMGVPLTGLAALALLLCTAALSSFLAMNFTGSTPFTSPSGVEKEMRRAIPLQLAAVVAAVGTWIGSAFV
ncbi:MAG: hypothetical protein JEZ11_05975 [Desulfobacterales bacterium]|nr:hypothetical protein [Desulfobacterales bacterium]